MEEASYTPSWQPEQSDVTTDGTALSWPGSELIYCLLEKVIMWNNEEFTQTSHLPSRKRRAGNKGHRDAGTYRTSMATKRCRWNQNLQWPTRTSYANGHGQITELNMCKVPFQQCNGNQGSLPCPSPQNDSPARPIGWLGLRNVTEKNRRGQCDLKDVKESAGDSIAVPRLLGLIKRAAVGLRKSPPLTNRKNGPRRARFRVAARNFVNSAGAEGRRPREWRIPIRRRVRTEPLEASSAFP
ncbi:hypothetical protein SKAU_G00187080 [Synaphobranchus kaupii]|uniref:Uncharacterized protein n=1 Tax=Synaphobranchus kaupii TaxID=118154 RepID=A0A9Q1IW06_SYNKA|nr:hypothetical protein SKAU_G00187080 [Synaphobranchus kaupii]